MLQEGPKLLHWNYFLALESDLERLSRFVEFTKDNYSTYSLEMAHLLLATCSEVDVVLKSLCKKINPSDSSTNINEYRKVVHLRIPKLSELAINIPRYGLNNRPWEKWKSGENPNWWTAYNDVKHHRAEKYSSANLQNTIAALAGLFVVNAYLYESELESGALLPLPSLMNLPHECVRALKQTSFGITIIYSLK